MTADLEWEVRVSRRVRHARLQVKPFGGLEVVIPPRFPRHQIPGFVAQHSGWIRTRLGEQARRRAAISLPHSIELALDKRRVTVVYHNPGQAINHDLFAPPLQDTLYIEGRDHADRVHALRNWIRGQAWKVLPTLLDQISRRTGLTYRKLTIRSQKTRWGSCSRRGNISLNDQLLFVPAPTVEYLMVHELCHTRQLNHSRRFWHLVEQYCPGYREHENRLAQPQDWVPEWFLADLYR